MSDRFLKYVRGVRTYEARPMSSKLSRAMSDRGMYLRCLLSFFDSELRMDVIRSGEWTCMKVHGVVIWGGPIVKVVTNVVGYAWGLF